MKKAITEYLASATITSKAKKEVEKLVKQGEKAKNTKKEPENMVELLEKLGVNVTGPRPAEKPQTIAEKAADKAKQAKRKAEKLENQAKRKEKASIQTMQRAGSQVQIVQEAQVATKSDEKEAEQEFLTNFEILKQEFCLGEKGWRDYGMVTMEFATAIVASVLRKILDPNKKQALSSDTVTNSGFSPVVVAMKNQLPHDSNVLLGTYTATNMADNLKYTKEGDLITQIDDCQWVKILDTLSSTTIGDSGDLVQVACMALLEQAERFADSSEIWVDSPFSEMVLSKKVYIKADDSKAYRENHSTPIQEVYRAVRRAIESSRAVQRDARNGYLYIELDAEGGIDTADKTYYRLHKWADLGGKDGNGNFTATDTTTYHEILEKLELSVRQLEIIRLRMQGHGYKAIATYLGVTPRAILNSLEKVQKKALKLDIALFNGVKK